MTYIMAFQKKQKQHYIRTNVINMLKLCINGI